MLAFQAYPVQDLSPNTLARRLMAQAIDHAMMHTRPLSTSSGCEPLLAAATARIHAEIDALPPAPRRRWRLPL